MRRRTLLTAGCGLILASPAIAQAPSPERATDEVDLLLVLAADISHSMQTPELRMQRDGYAAALRDKEVLDAIGSGAHGAIGITYLEWSGAEEQHVLVPWTRIQDVEDAARIAAMLDAAPLRIGSWTSISGAIMASRRLIAEAPFAAERSVVDISGDGENNHGGPVDHQRDAAVEAGITINGLPIIRHGARWAAQGQGRETALEDHYRQNVIGGFGAFLVPTVGFETFAGAIRRKLVLEIAGRDIGAAGIPA